MEAKQIKTKYEHAFNGYLHPVGDEYLLVFRQHEYQITTCWLRSDLSVIDDTYQDLIAQNIDPRLVQAGDRLLMTTSYIFPLGHERMELWPLKVEGRDVSCLLDGHRVFNNILGWPEYRHNSEKNWQPFVRGNKLFYIYEIKPHRVLEVDPIADEDYRGRVRLRHTEDWEYPWEGGKFPFGTVAPRGSVAPALLPNGDYLSIWHSKNFRQNIYADYWAGFYTFSSSPPYHVKFIGNAVWKPEDYVACNKRENNVWRRSYFPISMNVIGDQVQVCGGVNDVNLTVYTLPLEEVLSGLLPVVRKENKFAMSSPTTGKQPMLFFWDIMKARSELKIDDSGILGDDLQHGDRTGGWWWNQYVWMYVIGARFRPKRIVELGVRFGYSLKSLVAGCRSVEPDAEVELYGFDAEIDGRPSNEIATKVLGKLNPKVCKIVSAQVLTIEDLGIENCDLANVDADHSDEGTYRQLCLVTKALKPDGIILIDDVSSAQPASAVQRFCKEFGLFWEKLPSYNGIAIIKMNETSRNKVLATAVAPGNPFGTYNLKIRDLRGYYRYDLFNPILLKIHDLQRKHGCVGNVCEIGVYQGQSFFALACLTDRSKEISLAVDCFEDQQHNSNGPDHSVPEMPTKQRFQELCSWVLGVENNVNIVAGNSIEFSTKDYKLPNDLPYRLFHIDGSHLKEHALIDLHNAIPLMHEWGVIIVDDYLHPHWGGVTEAMDEFLGRDNSWQPFYVGGWKMMLCRREKFKEIAAVFEDAQENIASRHAVEMTNQGKWL